MRALTAFSRAAALGVLSILVSCAAPSQPAVTPEGTLATTLPATTLPATTVPTAIPPATMALPAIPPATMAPTTTLQSPDQLHPEVPALELKVMSFNIWLGG